MYAFSVRSARECNQTVRGWLGNPRKNRCPSANSDVAAAYKAALRPWSVHSSCGNETVNRYTPVGVAYLSWPYLRVGARSPTFASLRRGRSRQPGLRDGTLLAF